MTTFIYSRVSTGKQDTENQLAELRRRYHEATIVEETASGAKHRPDLEKLLSVLVEGDTLVVYALDRLGRRCGELVALLDDLNTRKINLVSCREGIDLGTMSGRFIAQLFCALAELERGMIGERTRMALQTKKDAGVRLGRPKTVSDALIAEIRTEYTTKKTTMQEIADTKGVSIATVHRAIRGQGGKEKCTVSSAT